MKIFIIKRGKKKNSGKVLKILVSSLSGSDFEFLFGPRNLYFKNTSGIFNVGGHQVTL